MQNFKDKVAVITGAGSGIGAGLVRRCIAEGMKVVLADINQQNLDQMAEELTSITTNDCMMFIKTDVSKKQDIQRLAEKTKKKFSQVDILFNHAGIPGPLGPIWKADYDEIEQVIKVNLLSMMYALKAFVPMMIEQNTPGYIVNTSSAAGLKLGFDMAGYTITKRSVVTLSETLSLDLEATKSKIKVSVFCPEMVATNFAKLIPKEKATDSESVKKLRQYFYDSFPAKGIPVKEAVDQVFEAIRNEKFYIFTHSKESYAQIKNITDNLLAGNNPIDLYK
ncbi:MAG: SDR family NAD(P)-dependent oxidoreductase [Gammaproteobacteria bacterium]|nr:SDR family NAD(P)-dependent oxidoreductase [Gammaproteobacteria bacterium]